MQGIEMAELCRAFDPVYLFPQLPPALRREGFFAALPVHRQILGKHVTDLGRQRGQYRGESIVVVRHTPHPRDPEPDAMVRFFRVRVKGSGEGFVRLGR